MYIDLSKLTKACSCGRKHQITVREIFIEPAASRHLERILGPCTHPVFICDQNTYNAAKASLAPYLEAYNTVILQGGDIHANDIYAAKLESLLATDADMLVAVGSGTIHDLTRYVAYSRQIPFISVPTAASVDGFVSTVAAMTWHGAKKTLPAAAPLYVLADTDIFIHAPYRLTASGISDLMGKYIALVDWKIAHLVTGEYICQEIVNLEMQAVKEVELILDRIQNGDPESLEKLMYALILSGLAMQMSGNSRPASGAEHHISHFWEMEILNDWLDALHGEKVSIGLLLCLEKYQQIGQNIRSGQCQVIDQRPLEMDKLADAYGKKDILDAILEENTPNPLAAIDLTHLNNKLPEIADILSTLPESHEIKEKLRKAGCMTAMSQIGLTDELKEPTLDLCPYVRNRLTFLRLSKLLR